MKLKAAILKTSILPLVMLAVCATTMAQLNRRPFLSDEGPTPSSADVILPGASMKRMSTPTVGPRSLENGPGEKQRSQRRNELLNRQGFDQVTANSITIPHWSDSFTYHGIPYEYTMVGTNPKHGSATTVIPTVLIPLRIVFGDGTIYDASTDIVDGQTPLQAFLNSPVFQNHKYLIGGADVGTTQYGDAFQRANMWTEVSNGAHDYHVLLGGPDVTPVQTIIVPTGKFGYQVDPDTHQNFPVVEDGFFAEQIQERIQALNLSPLSLQIFVTGTVSQFNSWGYHESVYDGFGEKTYIVAPYLDKESVFYGEHVPDAYVLSHEIAEWLDDPFVGSHPNFVPGWQFSGDTSPLCDSTRTGDLLEVGDPLVFSDSSVTPISLNSVTYHVTDAAFLPFFTRSNRSRSVNGQYTFFGSATAPTPPCVGHIEISASRFEFPGARLTVANGLSNRGQIVGYFRDASNRTHGFLLDRGRFTSLDFPAAVATVAEKVNDAGQIVGYYIDATGLPHGFLYQYGGFAQVDFPGSVDTLVFGINSAGEMVGSYDDANFVTHSFILRNGAFRSFDSPFAAQSEALAINDQQIVAGINWNDSGPFTGFVTDGRFAPYNVPGSLDTFPFSINDNGDLGGYFIARNWTAGFVTLYGYTYQIYPRVFGNNNRNQIVGRVFDFSMHRYVGFVSDLPKRDD